MGPIGWVTGAVAALLFAQPSGAVQSIPYRCADHTTIKVRYEGANRAMMIIKDRRLALQSAPSANGARYTGHGWQWWSTGMRTGSLAPLAAAEDIASTPGVSCRQR